MAAASLSSKRRRLDESGGGSHPAVLDASVRRQCNEILSWRHGNGGQKPMRTRDSCEEGRLAARQAKLKCRCTKALGTKPSERQLNQDEVRYYEWCLSDAALHEERPEWMAEGSRARNTKSGDAPSSAVHSIGMNFRKFKKQSLEHSGARWDALS